MIQWPCLFKLNGDDELLFVATQSALIEECAMLVWDDDDLLVDSSGQTYLVRQAIVGTGLAFKSLENALSLDEVTALIQKHEFSKAQTCITKIQFATIAEAIASLAWHPTFLGEH